MILNRNDVTLSHGVAADIIKSLGRGCGRQISFICRIKTRTVATMIPSRWHTIYYCSIIKMNAQEEFLQTLCLTEVLSRSWRDILYIRLPNSDSFDAGAIVRHKELDYFCLPFVENMSFLSYCYSDSRLQYFISSGNTDGTFTVNHNTGAITLARRIEGQDSFTLTYKVNDGLNEDETTIDVTVTKVFGDWPNFSQASYESMTTENDDSRPIIDTVSEN